MTIALKATLRDARADEIAALVDAGAGAGKLRIYDSTRPATGGAPTTQLAELVMSDPSFASSSSGVLTANAINDDAAADATGTATWFRVVDSDNNFVLDGDVSTSGADLNLNTVAITIGVNVAVGSFVFTEGNP